jgi:uncharacterized iron-regulated membrane protein
MAAHADPHARLRHWGVVHKWTSLACTLFLLVICLTGLPLIFSEEIEDWLDDGLPAATVPAGTPALSLDRIVAFARERLPGWTTDFVVLDEDKPYATVNMRPSPAAGLETRRRIRFDVHTGRELKQLPSVSQARGFMDVVRSLHTDLFAGLAGELFLAVVALAFIVAVVSGVVLYAPYMKKLAFGTVRGTRSARLKWLDLHNLLGIATLAWALVVGGTGLVNELSKPLFGIWQLTDVRDMLAPYAGKPPPNTADIGSAQAAFDTAQAAVPRMRITSVVFPGNPFGSPHHFLMWTKGDTPLTSRLFSPVLVDARTGALTSVVRMPWYLRALEVSRPLHFGDYGGLPLKVIWALLDLVTIAVLGSGLYLWVSRRRAHAARAARAQASP